jgi:glycosyltransferase involved in cell wall biosynthesis
VVGDEAVHPAGIINRDAPPNRLPTVANQVKRPDSVSLVIPLQDEEQSVVLLLRSVAAQEQPPDELILVDAGSRDSTVERARRVEPGCPLRIITSGRVFPGVARNLGVEAAKSEWVAFTDGGIELGSAWLRELLEAARDDTDAVFGNVDPVCDSRFRQCAAIAYVSPMNEAGIRGPFIASSLVRRSAILRLGGFPGYRAAEDLIFVHNLRAAGAREAYAPRATVAWQLPATTGSLFKRFALYSEHNLAAGWGRYWHRGVARLYALLVLIMGAAFIVAGGIAALAAVPLFFLARALKAAWAKRVSFAFGTLHPLRVFGAACILLVIDVATVVGAIRWLTRRPRG